MTFIYGNGVMMHVKIYKETLPSDCLNINEFRAIRINTHFDAHEYSLEQEFCLNFIFSAGNVNLISNLLVKHTLSV